MENLKWKVLQIWHVLFLVSWTVIWATAGILVRAFGGKQRTALRFSRKPWAPGLLRVAGVDLDVDGLEQLDLSKPYVFVSNHQSMMDIPVLFCALPTDLHYMIKKEIFSIPLLGNYLRAVGMLLIDRKNNAEAVETLKKAAARVAGGDSVIAFAEGTRSRTGSIASFKKGPFVMAIQAGVPVVPVALEGARQALPPDGFSIRPTTVRVKIGKPLITAHLTMADRDELRQRAHADVVRMHKEIGGLGEDSVVVMAGSPVRRGARKPATT